jgi:hypothetical protein
MMVYSKRSIIAIQPIRLQITTNRFDQPSVSAVQTAIEPDEQLLSVLPHPLTIDFSCPLYQSRPTRLYPILFRLSSRQGEVQGAT